MEVTAWPEGPSGPCPASTSSWPKGGSSSSPKAFFLAKVFYLWLFQSLGAGLRVWSLSCVAIGGQKLSRDLARRPHCIGIWRRGCSWLLLALRL